LKVSTNVKLAMKYFENFATLYATPEIPDVCTAIFLENIPQSQDRNCRTLNKKHCIVLLLRSLH